MSITKNNKAMETTIELKKQKSFAFGKDVYLLGKDEEGTKYWLEAPEWECSWYWGFGYIETYTNNDNPRNSRDINSHQHADNFMSKWFTEWNGSKPVLKVKTFTDEEGWKLSELFKSFYSLKEAAELFGRGGSHVTNNPCESILLDKELAKRINEEMIPAITGYIIKILTP